MRGEEKCAAHRTDNCDQFLAAGLALFPQRQPDQHKGRAGILQRGRSRRIGQLDRTEVRILAHRHAE